ETDPRVDLAACRRVGARSMVVVPLRYRDRPVGVLKVMAGTVAAFGPADVDTLRLLANLIGASVAQAGQIESLIRAASTDALTGVGNRRSFDDRVRELDGREGSESIGSIAIFDLDHFGAVNNQHGHVAGDAVLEAIGRILRERFRSNDLVARYG